MDKRTEMKADVKRNPRVDDSLCRGSCETEIAKRQHIATYVGRSVPIPVGPLESFS